MLMNATPTKTLVPECPSKLRGLSSLQLQSDDLYVTILVSPGTGRGSGFLSLVFQQLELADE